MFHIRDHKTTDMFSPFPQFGPKHRSVQEGDIEGTNSEIARLTGINRQRVRGGKSIQFAAILKTAGVQYPTGKYV
jgi:hypothetical protein